MRELPTYTVELNAVELGILVGALIKNDMKVSKRIWKVVEQFYKKVEA